MPAINFRKRFAGDVEAGKKRRTMRLQRHRPIKAGDTLYLYTGLRTQSCRKIGEAICTKTTGVVITDNDILVDGKRVSDAEEFSRQDGFANSHEMREFFAEQYEGLPVCLTMIEWELTAPQEPRP